MGGLADLLGDSPRIAALRDRIGQLLQRHPDASRLPPVLILGETGTGKSVLARAIHRASPRATGPFVAVNAAAIPETLLEAELFGFEKGAFTDARHAKAGLFQTAHRGTLFLDEVGLLPEPLQVKLLTVLEDRAVRRLGSTRAEPVDVWIVAATSVDLKAAIRARRFREDLYHRLAVLTLELPPLRDRGDDVERLAEHFLARACADYTLPQMTLAPDAREALRAYGWPGNVRELANLMERVALLAEGRMVRAATLALPGAGAGAARREEADAPGEEAAERARLLEALHETDWNVSRAATRLGLSRNAIRYRMEKHGLRPPEGEREPAPRRPDSRPSPSAGVGARPGLPTPDIGGPTPGPRPATTSAAAPPGGPADVRWARHHVALLRVDLAGGPGDGAVESDRALGLVIEKILGFGGRVEEVGLSRVVAAFGLFADEEAPRRAAHTAMAVLRALGATGREAAGGLQARIAIDVARLAIARAGDTVQIEGGARRRALERLEAVAGLARSGDVLATDAAAPFLDRRFALTPAGSGAMRLSGLDRTGLGLRAGMSPLVGREAELARLEAAFVAASRGGARVVDVVGEAGIGKSRLVHELGRRLEGRPHFLLQGHCTAFGGSTPFLPFIEIVRALFRLGEAEPPQAIARIGEGLSRLGLPADDARPFLELLLGLEAPGAALRGLNAEIVGARTRELLARILRERCRAAPVVLVVDDAHWIDSASEQLVLRLLTESPESPLLLLCTYRPPYRPPWAGRTDATAVLLPPLSTETCAHLVRERLGAGAGAEVVSRVVAAAEGNPLFAEEIARYLADQGGLAREQDAVPIPDTLAPLLLARVAHLDGPARELLEVASVVGRRFAADVVRAAAPPERDVERILGDLASRDLAFPAPGPDVADHAFKHVLVQETIYGSLPEARRAALHQRVAEAIETLYAGRLGEWFEALAHHYGRSGRTDRTARYLVLAGQRCLRVYSLDEAERHLEAAVALMAAPGGDEALFADAVLALSEVAYYRGDFRTLVSRIERHRARVEALDDAGRLSRLLFWLGFSRFFAVRCDEAAVLLEEALALAEAAGDETAAGHARMALAFTRWVTRGDEPRDVVARLGERALASAEGLGDAFLETLALHVLGLHAFTSGRYREARTFGRRLLGLGRRTGGPRALATGLHLIGLVEVYEERYAEAIDAADEAAAIAPDPMARLIARAVKGSALALGGRREGLALLEDVRREIIANDYLVLLTGVDYAYGAAMVLAGNLRRGVEWIEASIARFAEWGNEPIPAFGAMILGEVYLRLALGASRPPVSVLLRNLRFLVLAAPTATARARRHLGEAVRIAREADVPAVVARSLLGLGRLAAAAGDAVEARRHLDEALAVVTPLEVPTLEGRVRAALGALALPPAQAPRAV